MTDTKPPLTREQVRERRSGYVDGYMDALSPSVGERYTNAHATARKLAKFAYPLPPAAVPNELCLGDYRYRVSRGRLEFRENGGAGWKEIDQVLPGEQRPVFLRLVADLLENPTRHEPAPEDDEGTS